ncbi:MAG: polymer-forming cytoskeletal protein [Flavipsychrobacter sp.]|nr:polymer-forming cytoskeletal protein [Flavipsychrobacter sp.]
MLRKKIKNSLKSSFFPAESLSMIAVNMQITGNVDADHDMRIDGRINGYVRCKAKVVIGPEALVNGDLHAANADIFGTVTGNIYVEGLLSLRSKCVINGNLTVGSLDIQPDADFSGKCTMTQQGSSELSVSLAGLKL